MTHNPLTLEEYFHKIVNNPLKELTMFETMKAKWNDFIARNAVNISYSWTEEPTKETDDYWSFYARTNGYEEVPRKESFIQGEQDCTWMEIVDQVLDVLGHHYGYNIKEQVYYSVHFPLNDPDCAGYGRELNDEVLQKLLLTHPEVYEATGHIE